VAAVEQIGVKEEDCFSLFCIFYNILNGDRKKEAVELEAIYGDGNKGERD
jgi:hypothetical protein